MHDGLEPFDPLDDTGTRLVASYPRDTHLSFTSSAATEGDRTSEAAQRLAAIVQFSDDAIIAKDLNGIVTDWNRGAERLFGYTAEEMIGKPIGTIIPTERRAEEGEILSRLRRGERVDHYETVRQRRDGSLVDISLTVSPILDRAGKVVGASKIARDITEQKRAEGQRLLLLREMNHRVKNLFALSNSLVSLSARSATSIKELVASLHERFGALSRAHSLTLRDATAERGDLAATLQALIQAAIAPFVDNRDETPDRISSSGDDITVRGSDVTNFALVFHELTANAAKHGALTQPAGELHVECRNAGDRVVINWRERAILPSDFQPGKDGFGTFLMRSTIVGTWSGELDRRFLADGLSVTISVPLSRLRMTQA